MKMTSMIVAASVALPVASLSAGDASVTLVRGGWASGARSSEWTTRGPHPLNQWFG